MGKKYIDKITTLMDSEQILGRQPMGKKYTGAVCHIRLPCTESANAWKKLSKIFSLLGYRGYCNKKYLDNMYKLMWSPKR